MPRQHDPGELAVGNVPGVFRVRGRPHHAGQLGKPVRHRRKENGRAGLGRAGSRQSKLEQVFLTNDFDDPLEGFDTNRYIPCLRTDDLVFHLAKPEVRNG